MDETYEHTIRSETGDDMADTGDAADALSSHAPPADKAGDIGAEEHVDDPEESTAGVLATLRHKMLRVGTMTPSLRLFTGVAGGELLAVALLVALHPLMGGAITLGVTDHQTTQMPLVIFVAAVLFLWVSWSLLLSGAIAGHWILRAPVLAIFSYVLLQPPVLALAGDARLALLVALWGWALASSLVPWAARAVESSHPRLAARLHRVARWFDFTRTVPLIAAGIGAYFLVLLASANWGRGNMLFPEYITIQLEELTFFLSPVLFLAGTDFVELSEVVAGRVVSLTRLPRGPWVLIALSAIFALFIVGQNVFLGDPLPRVLTSILWQAGIAAVVVAALVALVRWSRVGRWRPTLLPFAALVLVTVGVMAGFGAYMNFYLAHVGQPSLLGKGDYAIYRQTAGGPTFSVAYPKTWRLIPIAAGDNAVIAGELFDGTHSPYPAVMYVLVASTSVLTSDQMLAQASDSFCKPGCLGGPRMTTQGAWHVETLTTKDHLAGLWTQTRGQDAVILMVEAATLMYPLLAPTFADIAGSWRLDLGATAPTPTPALDPTVDARALALALAVPALLGLMLGLLLLARFRMRGGRWAMAGLFASVFGVLVLALDLQRVVGSLGLPSGHLGFSLVSVQLAVALGILGVVGWLLARRGFRVGRWRDADLELLALLLTLALGVQAVLWFIDLFDASMAVTLAVAQAVILIVGMSWDLLMSGEQITNVEGRAFPRQARVLLYLGYMALVATAVLYFSTQSSAAPGHAHIEPFFDDDSWPQQGLLYLGVPLLLTGFLVEVSRWWRKVHAPAEVERVAVVPVAIGESPLSSAPDTLLD